MYLAKNSNSVSKNTRLRPMDPKRMLQKVRSEERKKKKE